MVIDEQLKIFLKEHGFTPAQYIDNDNALKKELYKDCELYVEIGEYDSYVSEFTVWFDFTYKYNEFEKTLYLLYRDHYSLANKYILKPQVDMWGDSKLHNFASTSLEFSTEILKELDKDIEWSTVESGFNKMHLFELIVDLKLITNDKNLFDLFFRNKFGELFIMIDSVWLFIFLSYKMGFSIDRVEKEFQRAYMYWHKKRSNLQKNIDKDIIKLYYEICKGVRE